jgi:hypothetical protein
MQRECDPDLCSKPSDTTHCGNMGLFLRRRKKCFVGASLVEGLGVYAAEDIREGDLVAEYTGELIAEEEADYRAYALSYHRSYASICLGDSTARTGTDRSYTNSVRNSSQPDHSVHPSADREHLVDAEHYGNRVRRWLLSLAGS